MQLTNKTDQDVAFKELHVMSQLQCRRSTRLRLTCNARISSSFRVLSSSMGRRLKTFTPEMFSKEPDGVVEEFKVKVVYIPCNPPSPVPEVSEEGIKILRGIG